MCSVKVDDSKLELHSRNDNQIFRLQKKKKKIGTRNSTTLKNPCCQHHYQCFKALNNLVKFPICCQMSLLTEPGLGFRLQTPFKATSSFLNDHSLKQLYRACCTCITRCFVDLIPLIRYYNSV